MNDQSPPKRVTRARAAAKTAETDVKTTKIATAASKAKVTRSASTTKRKTRADDVQDGEQDELSGQIIEPAIPQTRGRAKRGAIAEPEPKVDQDVVTVPARVTRGRPKKLAAEESVTTTSRQKAQIEQPAEYSVPEPTRSLRGRQKKVEVPEEESITAMDEPPKKPTRARVAAVSKAAPKKSVKFEEPDKENILPVPTNAKGNVKAAEAGTGLKARPVRKAAVAATRATRGRPKAEEQKSSPLSPKKATQVATAKDLSEDELATTEKTPMKPLMKSPIKAPGSIFGTAKKLDFSTSITVNKVGTQDLRVSVLASPARRPPTSPFKDGMKSSPQKLNLGETMFKSPFKFSHPTQHPGEPTSAFKASMLQSPARRPPSPTKVMENGSPSRSGPLNLGATPKASTFKISRFTTPRTLTKSAFRPGLMLPPSTLSKDSAQDSKDENAMPDNVGTPAAQKSMFSGRLSSIMPREVDSALLTVETVVEDNEDQVMVDQVETEDAITREDIITVNSVAEEFTPQPLQTISSAFTLRDNNDSPFDDSESDSEDELTLGSQRSSGPLGDFKRASSDFKSSPATPSPFSAIAKTPRNSVAKSAKSVRSQKIGFTPLAKQLTEWMAASPEKSESVATEPDELSGIPECNRTEENISMQPSPSKSTFFDDEMSVREEMQSVPEEDDEILDSINFAPVELDEEDLDLALEADELSVLEPEEIVGFQQDLEFLNDAEQAKQNEELDLLDAIQSEDVTIIQQQCELDMVMELEQPRQDHKNAEIFESEELNLAAKEEEEAGKPVLEAHEVEEPTLTILELEQQRSDDVFQPVDDPYMSAELSHDGTLSEASQEYGDENAMPIDPELLALPTAPTPLYATPKRILTERVFHTVSKVPLKAAAEDTPMRPSLGKRGASISRLPPQRPTENLTRNNTVISYSPLKTSVQTSQPIDNDSTTMHDTPVTPSKPEAEVWSTIATPARTPRRDIDTSLLNGAVVFVDVHTSEGADASLIFTELLTQMGARCVKTWNWSGNPDDGSKIGITHVVFKDGGKRTLEKSRATGGVVSCVGVGWVLDCERENKWLPESPYSIDTTMVPRGGHRRRKSMEPKALANMNGTLLPSVTPLRNSRKTMSPTKVSFVIPETPFTSKSHRRDSVQWIRSPSTASSSSEDHILSPVPATPAPEYISAYAEEGLYGDDTPGNQTPYFLHKEQLVQKTAPPGKRYFDGEGDKGGFLSVKKDESVMMRLMAARRKSLQFAPKIGSPLAKRTEW
ncbi:hypothetical protein B0O99DRAFT_609960 [Bisporella sp. PMI_857]|nr:hypothetical protein B0O99DRAFT_609960 [Bisporella sp. PMI_857]